MIPVLRGIFYQSEGFPLTGYSVPACVGRWAWPGQKNCRRAVVGVIFPNARFSKEKLHKTMFCEEFKEYQWFSEGELPNLQRIYINVWFLYSYGIFIYMEILMKKWISHIWLLCELHALCSCRPHCAVATGPGTCVGTTGVLCPVSRCWLPEEKWASSGKLEENKAQSGKIQEQRGPNIGKVNRMRAIYKKLCFSREFKE